MKVSVLGLGYVGLPVLLGLSNKTDHKVVGFDISKAKVDLIAKGKLPFDDDSIKDDFESSRKLDVTTSEKDIKDSDVVIVCVPTPIDKDYEPDYKPLLAASTTAISNLKKGGIIVVESTINPGTCEEVVAPAPEIFNPKYKLGSYYSIVHAPERINPGDNKWNIYNIPRNIGGSTKKAAKRIHDLYAEFINADLNVVSTLKVAESSKIVENSFRDINIAFVNELAKSFDAMGVDLIETIGAASNKPFGYMPFWPGPGVGGHCIAVDPYYLIKRAAKSGFNHRLLKEGRNINNSMPEYVVENLGSLLNEIEKPIKGTKIALLGMSYKANVGDLRESPAIEVEKILKKKGADLIIYEPYVPEISKYKNLDKTLGEADAIILLAAHSDFRSINIDLLKKNKIKVVLDTRAFFNKEDFEGSGILFTGVGR